MSVQITIVGLGQIGSSIGLALKAHNVDVYRVGHDKDPQAAKESQKMGAVDNVKYNLPASVREAKIVILARLYIGLTPAINPEYLHGTEFGVKAARADLFENGLIVVNAPLGTPGNAFNLAMEFVNLLGAKPLLMDTTEVDGIFSAMHTLPQLAAAALLDITVDTPGWQEARKLAGRPYATTTAGVAYHDDMASLGETALENRENIVRLLNAYITSLINLRDEIDANDREAVTTRLEEALKGRIRWFDERIAAEWLKGAGQSIDAPSFGDRVNQMIFGGLMTDRPRQRK